MSEYVSKKALLEWLKKRLDETQFVIEARALADIIAKIECGRFDADQTEVQRLRAALEHIKEHEMHHYKYKTDIWYMADEGLSGVREKEEIDHD